MKLKIDEWKYVLNVEHAEKPIETKDYPTRTPRPHYSVLNKAKIKATYGIEIPYWEDSLERCLRILKIKHD